MLKSSLPSEEMGLVGQMSSLRFRENGFWTSADVILLVVVNNNNNNKIYSDFKYCGAQLN